MSPLRRVILADVPSGGIVRYRGEWGVVCASSWQRHGWRIVDFWVGGRCWIPDIAEVDLLPPENRVGTTDEWTDGSRTSVQALVSSPPGVGSSDPIPLSL